MQSHGITFISATTRTGPATEDVLETKAIAEYERDRKRAHKGHDTKRKAVVSVDHGDAKHGKTPAWKRAGGGGEEKERRVLSRLGRDIREDKDDADQWFEEPVGAEENEVLDKENRPSGQPALVCLEELVVRTAARGSKKHSRPLTTRPSAHRQTSITAPFNTVSSHLLPPLMDCITIPPTGPANDYDNGFFEFSSPGSDEWTVAAIEDGCLRYSTCGSVASASSATTVLVMPCNW